MLQTPLAGEHEKLRARMTDFAGWRLPIQYEGIVAEHHRTRRHCSIFDTCHMGRLELTGPDSLRNLGRILTVDASIMDDGQCRYGFLLKDDGGILDDLVVYRFHSGHWWVVVNAGTRLKDLSWIQHNLSGHAVLTDLTDSIAKVDVQGPESPRIASTVLQQDLSFLPRFRSTPCIWADKRGVVSRTGYTGEDGYEIYIDVSGAVSLWNAFIHAGAAPAGLGARDTLRLEAALPLYGHELTESVTPVDASLTRFIANPMEFIGKPALQRTPARILSGFRISGRRSARAGDRIAAGDLVVGVVTSGSFSPTLECGIGLAYIDREFSAIGQSLSVHTDRGDLAATVAETPFYRRPKR